MEHENLHTLISPELKAGPMLLVEVRAAFVRKGTSLSAWCGQNQIHRQNAAAALKGDWAGPGALALVSRIVKAAAA